MLATGTVGGISMSTDRREIAEAFDRRARTYVRSQWHRTAAERLVALCRLRPGSHVLDAGTGTGLAALAAAREVGSEGLVVGVDLSPGMLSQARTALGASGLGNVELVEGDAVCLSQYGPGTFDVVTCVQGLLYMPAADALREWHRLLRRGGLVAFSNMRSGSPPARRLFGRCAAELGISLRDPGEPLGSVSACRNALEAAGYQVVDIVSETVEFSPEDLALAWESNVRSAGHEEVRRLGAAEQRALKDAYDTALANAERESPGSVRRAGILYAFGRR